MHGILSLTEFEKLYVSLRFWLLGRNFHIAAKALQFAREHHTGTRKDGITPEFEHQLRVTHYVRTLSSGLTHPERKLAACLLHDITEDHGVPISVLSRMFGDDVSHVVYLMSKEIGGVRKSDEHYFSELADDPDGSILKGADRIHNFQSMVGVFSPDKQRQYMEEARTYILPMLKKARRRFTEQEPAYQNTKLVLVSQMELIEAIHAADKKGGS